MMCFMGNCETNLNGDQRLGRVMGGNGSPARSIATCGRTLCVQLGSDKGRRRSGLMIPVAVDRSYGKNPSAASSSTLFQYMAMTCLLSSDLMNAPRSRRAAAKSSKVRAMRCQGQCSGFPSGFCAKIPISGWKRYP